MIKLVATDIDGTLLVEGTDEINTEIYEIVLKLKEKGVVFCAASGRQYDSMEKLFAPIAREMIFIADNGAYVVCRGVDMQVITLQPEDSWALVEEIRTMEGCEPVLSTKDEVIIESKDQEFRNLLTRGYKNHVRIVEDLLQVKGEMIKVAVYREKGVAPIAPQLIAKWKDKFRGMQAGRPWIDFMHLEADKGHAIASIQKALHILPEETMVFGDNENDINMIRQAGYGIAMGNAAPKVKAAADYIADTNVNDGVLKILREVEQHL